jgi:hypothetical protein
MLKFGPSELLTIHVIGFVGPGRASNIWKASPLFAALFAFPIQRAANRPHILPSGAIVAALQLRKGKGNAEMMSLCLQQQKYLDNFRDAFNVTDVVLQFVRGSGRFNDHDRTTTTLALPCESRRRMAVE